jgi:uncharacterized protein DUF998
MSNGPQPGTLHFSCHPTKVLPKTRLQTHQKTLLIAYASDMNGHLTDSLEKGEDEMNTMNVSSVSRSEQKALSRTRILLLCGAIAGPLFLLILLIQDYTVPGFDPRLDMLSLLSLGSWGWVQIANFVLAGALNLLYAVGLWWRLYPGRAGIAHELRNEIVAELILI